MLAAVQVDGLVKRYGRSIVLDRVSITVAEGDCFALLGPNGAGKTTLLHVLAGLLRFQQGEVAVSGHALPGAAGEVRRIVGFVPQEIALYDELTAREALVHAGRLHALAPRTAKARAKELLRLVRLEAKEHAPCGTLSGGMRHRLNVALGLAHDPRLLMLDEPTTGLDPGARESAWQVLESLRDEGRTLLLSTHNLDEARRLATRAAVLREGRVLASGATATLEPALAEAFGGEP